MSHSLLEDLKGGLCTSNFEEIPIIDLQNLQVDTESQAQLAAQIRAACVNRSLRSRSNLRLGWVLLWCGFIRLEDLSGVLVWLLLLINYSVRNHGIPDHIISGALDAGKRFFAQPLETKLEIDIRKSDNFKGYTALLQENVDPNGLGDLHEGFDLGWESEDPPSTTTGEMYGQNVWPRDLPGFKEPVATYYHHAISLGKNLFSLFALALDLPRNFFEDKITRPAAIMRLLHYPPQPPSVEADDRQIGIGSHTDYECFTILWQDDVGGLQVQNKRGNWINASPVPGTLVINLGDQFARWTNDVFVSTPHRAINRSGKERYSIPLFFGTDYDVPLTPIPTCISADRPAKYEVVTAGEYVKSRLAETYV